MYAFHTEIRESTHLDILQVADIIINLYNYLQNLKLFRIYYYIYLQNLEDK